jgi:hypothetical protein
MKPHQEQGDGAPCPYNITCTPILHHSTIQHLHDPPDRAPLGYRSKPMLVPDFRFWCLTGKVAATKLDETTSLGGTAGGPIGGRHCPNGIDGQPSTRFTNPTNGEVYTHSTVRAPEENDEICALTTRSVNWWGA